MNEDTIREARALIEDDFGEEIWDQVVREFAEQMKARYRELLEGAIADRLPAACEAIEKATQSPRARP